MIVETLLVSSLIVIAIGFYGAMVYKNLIKVFISIEIMFFGLMMFFAVLSLVSGSASLIQLYVLIIAVVSALEEAVGIGIILAIKRIKGDVTSDLLESLKH